jgi:predicted Zn finger-like uncharacterized protein
MVEEPYCHETTLMAITTTCPACEAGFNLPDELAGQMVRCQRCEQTFVVPMPPELAAPPAPVAETPATEEPAPATLAEAPKRKPPVPVSGAGVGWTTALVALFLFSVLGSSVFAVVWIIVHLGPPIQAASARPVRPPIENRDAGPRKDDRIALDKDRFKDFAVKDRPRFDKDLLDKDRKFKDFPPPLVVPVPIVVGFDGRAFVNGRTEKPLGIDDGKWNQDGPYRLHKIQLQQGKTYNFHVSSNHFTPRVQIFDGDNKVAECVGAGPFQAWRAMLAFQPKRSGEHLILINSVERFSAGFFAMSIAPENRPVATAADLTAKTTYTHFGQLRVEDPLEVSPKKYGPYHEYDVTLEADKDYTFTVTSQFNVIPVLQIHEDKRILEHVGGDRKIDFNDFRVAAAYRPPNSGKYRVRVTSKDFGLVNYTLTIATKAVAVQTILAALDGTGTFADQRELSPSDPKLAGRGHYKAYLITLEQGKKYRIEMTQKGVATSLILLDPIQQKVGDVTDAPLVFTAQRTGMYKLRVAASLPKAREPYSLRITTEP